MACRLASGTLRGQTQDTNTGCTRSMHPHGGAIGKHMAVGIQGKVPCQTTDLESANHTEQVFKGTLLTLRLFEFFLSVWVDVQGGKADLRSVSEGNFYLRHLR